MDSAYPKHLFADINFRSAEDVDLWKTTFPDPSNSPACHTHTLSICWIQVEADAWVGGLIQTFSQVARLRLTRTTFGDSLLLAPSIMKHLSLAPFYNLSPTLKLLHVYFGFLTCSQIFNFVRSSPLFEDLVLSSLDLTPGNDETPHEPHAIGLSPPPVLTGFLGFNVMEGMGNIAHRLWICRMVFTSEGSHSRRSTRGIFDG